MLSKFEKTAVVGLLARGALAGAGAVAKKGGKLLYRAAGGTPLAAGMTALGALGDAQNTKAKFDRAYMR